MRDDPDADLSGLNRDLEHTRDITRDDETYMDFYVSKQALEEIASGFAGITSQVTGLANQLRALTAKLPEGCEGTGKLGLDAYKSMLREGVSEEQAKAILQDPNFDNLVYETFNFVDPLYSEHGMSLVESQRLMEYGYWNENGEYVETSPKYEDFYSKTQDALDLLVKINGYVNSIEDIEKKQATIYAVKGLMGGPVKFVLNQAVGAIVGYVAGDAITAAYENVATYLDWRKDRESYIDDRVTYGEDGLTKEQIAAEVTTKGEAVGFAANILIGLGSRMVKVVKPDIPHISGTSERGDWSLGKYKSDVKWANQMKSRGWTPEQISETLSRGEPSATHNYIHDGHTAIKYTDIKTGKYVVYDPTAKEIIQIGGDGFKLTPKP